MRSVSEDETIAWYERQTGDEAIWFTVYEVAYDRPIGLADFWDIERDHGICWFGMMIGEADHRGKGHGSETTRLMLDVAFTALGMYSVMLTVDSFNVAGIRAYAKAGFREIGRWQGATLLAGERYDRVFMAAHAQDFQSPVLRTRLSP